MAKTPQKRQGLVWRTIVASILIVVGAVSLLGAIVTRYAERNILHTEGYTNIVGPLPQDPKVSDALATFTTSKIFDASNAEASLKEFLPPKLAPLAGPLTDTLEKRAHQTAKEFIAGDTFGAIWTTSNTIMQKGVIRLAETKAGEGKLQAAGSLNLSGLTSAVRERFGQDATVTSQQQVQAANIRINLQQRVERLRTVVRYIKSGAYALPYITLAAFIAAVAIAYNRRKVVIGVGVSVLLLGVVALLAAKVVSGNLLNDIADPLYRDAGRVIYEAFYSDLRTHIIAAMIFGGLLIILGICAEPYAWAVSLRRTLKIPRLKASRFGHWVQGFRKRLMQSEPWIDLVAIAAAIIWLLALPTLTTSTVIVICCVLVTCIGLAHLASRPSPHKRYT